MSLERHRVGYVRRTLLSGGGRVVDGMRGSDVLSRNCVAWSSSWSGCSGSATYAFESKNNTSSYLVRTESLRKYTDNLNTLQNRAV